MRPAYYLHLQHSKSALTESTYKEHCVSAYPSVGPVNYCTQIHEHELLELIADISTGIHFRVEANEKMISNEQFIRIVSASSLIESNVNEINVAENEIGDDAIKKLVSLLSKNFKIRILNLAYNNITDNSITSFLEILETNVTLTSINLFKNPISDHNLLRLQVYLDRNAKIQKDAMDKEFHTIPKKKRCICVIL